MASVAVSAGVAGVIVPLRAGRLVRTVRITVPVHGCRDRVGRAVPVYRGRRGWCVRGRAVVRLAGFRFRRRSVRMGRLRVCRLLAPVIRVGSVVAVGRRARLRAIADEPVVADRASVWCRARLGTVADRSSVADRTTVRSSARLRMVADGMRVATDCASVAVVTRAEERNVRGGVRSPGSEYERRDNACNPEFH
jgi:hypothetical protein